MHIIPTPDPTPTPAPACKRRGTCTFKQPKRSVAECRGVLRRFQQRHPLLPRTVCTGTAASMAATVVHTGMCGMQCQAGCSNEMLQRYPRRKRTKAMAAGDAAACKCSLGTANLPPAAQPDEASTATAGCWRWPRQKVAKGRGNFWPVKTSHHVSGRRQARTCERDEGQHAQGDGDTLRQSAHGAGCGGRSKVAERQVMRGGSWRLTCRQEGRKWSTSNSV